MAKKNKGSAPKVDPVVKPDATPVEVTVETPTPERAHNPDGTFTADNPDTPEVNEAFVQPVDAVVGEVVPEAATVDDSMNAVVSPLGNKVDAAPGKQVAVPAPIAKKKHELASGSTREDY